MFKSFQAKKDIEIETVKKEQIEEIKQIGRGTFGEVFKVKHEHEIKALKKYSCRSWDANGKKVMKEAKIMKGLRHKNIVKFYAACIEESNISILMEYCGFDFSLFGDDVTVNT